MSKLLVVTGPSGVGKTYLAGQLSRLYPEVFETVKIFSTRKPRTNEKFVDRIFITKDEFKDKKNKDEFVFSGSFHGNQYGYSRESLIPTSKNLIVNAWPAFIPKFAVLPDVVLLGLTVKNENLSLLQQRMLDRGDSLKQVKERLTLVNRDIKDLHDFNRTIGKYGRVFTVNDDKTIPEVVIPWLEEKLIKNTPNPAD